MVFRHSVPGCAGCAEHEHHWEAHRRAVSFAIDGREDPDFYLTGLPECLRQLKQQAEKNAAGSDRMARAIADDCAGTSDPGIEYATVRMFDGTERKSATLKASALFGDAFEHPTVKRLFQEGFLVCIEGPVPQPKQNGGLLGHPDEAHTFENAPIALAGGNVEAIWARLAVFDAVSDGDRINLDVNYEAIATLDLMRLTALIGALERVKLEVFDLYRQVEEAGG